MKYSFNTRSGNTQVNEDRLAVKELKDGSILAVMADGMGGLDHGEIAAELAVNHNVRDSYKAVDRSFLLGLQVRVKFLGNLEAEFEGLDVALGDGCIRNVEVLSQ